MQDETYDPLDYNNLAESVRRALLGHPLGPLPPHERPLAAGVYAIYYAGDFPAYARVSIDGTDENAETQVPIYVGRARAKRGKKGAGRELSGRLGEHARAVDAAHNLALASFYCRYLVVEDVWIDLAEQFLIDHFQPLWNVVVTSFGSHDPGRGRRDGKLSAWSALHSGRPWDAKHAPGQAVDEILVAIEKHLTARFGTL